VAVARLYGEPLFRMPQDLYIPPDALEVFLEAFEGPLDLLLYLIRKQNFNILDIPLADVTRQYLEYVDQIRNAQPRTGQRVPADGGDAHRDQEPHAAAAEEERRRQRGPKTRAPNWCAACSNTSRSSWPPPSSTPAAGDRPRLPARAGHIEQSCSRASPTCT
jgi:hypothetical protein